MDTKAAMAPSQWVAGIGLLALACALYASPPSDADIDVRIEKRGPWIVVDIDPTVRATVIEALVSGTED